MSNPYVGEIRMFAGNFAPNGWAFCDGSLLAISQNDVLYSLLGTTYGGDGVQTFALPDLRGRLPIHNGTGPGLSTYVIGQMGGVENVTVTSNQLPIHTHQALAAAGNTGNSFDPTGRTWAGSNSGDLLYNSSAPNTTFVPTGSAGGNQPHNNLQPYLCINYIISLFGIYPSPN